MVTSDAINGGDRNAQKKYHSDWKEDRTGFFEVIHLFTVPNLRWSFVVSEIVVMHDRRSWRGDILEFSR
jgi:hypothetical protein